MKRVRHWPSDTLTGWSLGTATGVSGDGLVIVGRGYNPTGQLEGWVVDLRPTP